QAISDIGERRPRGAVSIGDIGAARKYYAEKRAVEHIVRGFVHVLKEQARGPGERALVVRGQADLLREHFHLLVVVIHRLVRGEEGLGTADEGVEKLGLVIDVAARAEQVHAAKVIVQGE